MFPIWRPRTPTSISPLMTDHFLCTWKEAMGEPAEKNIVFPRISFWSMIALGFKFWLAKTPGKISLSASWKQIAKVASLGFVYPIEENMAERIYWKNTIDFFKKPVWAPFYTFSGLLKNITLRWMLWANKSFKWLYNEKTLLYEFVRFTVNWDQ